jgi:3-hydroxyacyl-CoA dehydrogenase
MEGQILRQTDRAAVTDLGDGVLLLRWHGRIDPDTAQWAEQALTELVDGVAAILLTSSEGYDNEALYELADGQKWEILETAGKAYQSLTNTIRHHPKPMVMALESGTFDFGLELALNAAAVVAAPDVPLGFNLKKNRFAPVGGGLAELALKTYAVGNGVQGVDLVPFFKRIYHQICFGKPLTGLTEAADKGISLSCACTCAKEEVITKAKTMALYLANCSCQRQKVERTTSVLGLTGAAAMEITAINMQLGGFLAADALILAAETALVLSGGKVPKGTIVNESQLRQLELEIFLAASRRWAKEDKS